MTSKKTEPPLALDMPFDEALRRFVQTNPKQLKDQIEKDRKVTRPDRPSDQSTD